MTIAAGFECTDGVLLASDTLYSGDNKRYGRKLWLFQRGPVVVGFGGSGTQGGLERTQYEIGRQLNAGMSLAQIVEMIEGVLQRVLEKQKPSPENRTCGLFAFRLEGECKQLFENVGGAAMLSPVGHPSQCVGWAVALGQYFQDSLYSERMSLGWARVVAAHLIKQAKRYSEHCGGDTHLLEIPASGEPHMIEAQEEIRSLEAHLAEVDEAMRVVLPDDRADDDTAKHRLEMLKEAIQKCRKSFAMPALAGTLRVSGSLVATKITQSSGKKSEGSQ